MGKYELSAQEIGEGVGPQFLGNLVRVGSKRWTIDLKFEAAFFLRCGRGQGEGESWTFSEKVKAKL